MANSSIYKLAYHTRKMNLPDPREEALDALITASLHLFDSEPTEKEIRLFLEQPPVLPEDKRRALANYEKNPMV